MAIERMSPPLVRMLHFESMMDFFGAHLLFNFPETLNTESTEVSKTSVIPNAN